MATYFMEHKKHTKKSIFRLFYFLLFKILQGLKMCIREARGRVVKNKRLWCGRVLVRIAVQLIGN